MRNQSGFALISTMVLVAALAAGGLLVYTAMNQKTDMKVAYSLKSNGFERLRARAKAIPQFYDDFLDSNRTHTASKVLVNQCIPAQTEIAPQNFTQCSATVRMNSNDELKAAYARATVGTLNSITETSFMTTLPLVDAFGIPFSDRATQPALYDIAGMPCVRDCYYSVVSYMIKEQNPGTPGDVIFAFKISDISTKGVWVSRKPEWIFVPVVKEVWNSMPFDLADAKPLCADGSYAFKITGSGRVVCRDIGMSCPDGTMLGGINANGDAFCVPEPIWIPALTITDFACDSWGYKQKYCPYPMVDKNASIKDISVQHKRSKSGCNKGSDFGATSTGVPQVWVDHGCRATFNIETACNGGFALLGSLCQPTMPGSYSPPLDNKAYDCTNAPVNAHYTGGGGSTNNCPWVCDVGYKQVGNSCQFIPVPTPTPAPTPAPTPVPTPTPVL